MALYYSLSGVLGADIVWGRGRAWTLVPAATFRIVVGISTGSCTGVIGWQRIRLSAVDITATPIAVLTTYLIDFHNTSICFLQSFIVSSCVQSAHTLTARTPVLLHRTHTLILSLQTNTKIDTSHSLARSLRIRTQSRSHDGHSLCMQISEPQQEITSF